MITKKRYIKLVNASYDNLANMIQKMETDGYNPEELAIALDWSIKSKLQLLIALHRQRNPSETKET